MNLKALPCYKDRPDLTEEERLMAEAQPYDEGVCKKLKEQLFYLPKLILDDEGLIYAFVSFHADEVLKHAKKLNIKIDRLKLAESFIVNKYRSSYRLYIHSSKVSQSKINYLFAGTLKETHKDFIPFIKALVELIKNNDPRVLSALRNCTSDTKQ